MNKLREINLRNTKNKMEYIYGALLLHKLGQEVNEGNLKKVLSAAGAQVDDAKVKVLVASLQGVNIEEQLANASLAVSAGAGSAGSAGAEAPKEEKKEEPRAEAAEGLASLFG
jgi:large subunit ribosomal protein L12